MKNKRFIIILVFILGVVSFGVAKFASIRRAPKVAKEVFPPAPDFMLMDIYGEEKKLSDYKGKVVIITFWTTWCGPCKKEVLHFIELYRAYRDEGLEIVGVALDWNAERVVAPFVYENGINYTVLLGNRDVSDLYGGILSIPTTFVLDRDGGIRKRYIGYQDKEVFEKDIKEIL